MASVDARFVRIKVGSSHKPVAAGPVPARVATSPARAAAAENTKNAAVDRGAEVRFGLIENLSAFAPELFCP